MTAAARGIARCPSISTARTLILRQREAGSNHRDRYSGSSEPPATANVQSGDITETNGFLFDELSTVAVEIVNISGRREDECLRPVLSIDRHHDPISLYGEDRHRLIANPNDIARLENQLGIHAESASRTNDLDQTGRLPEGDVSGDYTPLIQRNSIRFARKRKSA